MTALQRDEAEASVKTTLEARLSELAQHTSVRVRCAVANNFAASDGVLTTLLDDPSDLVRISAASTVKSRPSTHGHMIDSPDKWVRAVLVDALVDDPFAISYDHQHRLAGDSFKEARHRLAGRTPYAKVFEILLTDPDADVRGWCAANPRISLAQMEQLVTDRAWRTRALTAVNGLRFPTDEHLVRLAADRSAHVRWAVLARVDAREALELIAKDTDDMNKQHAKIVLQGNGVNSPDVTRTVRKMRAATAYKPFV